MNDSSDPAVQAWRRMRELVFDQQAQVKAAAREIDLSPLQAMTLFRISREGPLPMGAIAESLGSDRSHLTRLVDRLEELDLVVRQPGETDRRSRDLVLTDHGTDVVATFSAMMDRPPEGFIALSEREKKALAKLMQRIDRNAHECAQRERG